MKYNKSLILMIFLTSGMMVSCGGESEPIDASAPTNSQSTTANSTPEVENSTVSEASTPPSVDRGESLYKRCKTCHTLNEGGAHKTGPNLFDIFGATAGSKDGFRYSKVMRDSGVIWTDENLAAYIKNPAKFMPRNTMSFAGIRKDEDVALLLEYMRSEMNK